MYNICAQWSWEQATSASTPPIEGVPVAITDTQVRLTNEESPTDRDMTRWILVFPAPIDHDALFGVSFTFSKPANWGNGGCGGGNSACEAFIDIASGTDPLEVFNFLRDYLARHDLQLETADD